MAEKRYLMTPGPTPAPPEVLAAIAQPVIHHRGPDYRELYARVLARLREVFRTEQEVLLFGGSGSGAMESAVANLCSPGDPVLQMSLLLAGIHITLGLIWLSVFAYFVSRLSELLSRANMKRRLERVTGALLVALGLRLVWERR